MNTNKFSVWNLPQNHAMNVNNIENRYEGLVFESHLWDSVGMHNKCYNYAINLPRIVADEDPLFKNNINNINGIGLIFTQEEYFLEDLLANVANAGLIGPEQNIPNDWEYNLDRNSHIVALFYFYHKVLYDYHWYRRERDGYWSHKSGIDHRVKKIDQGGNLILDPRTCNRGQDYEDYNFVGFFLCRPRQINALYK